MPFGSYYFGWEWVLWLLLKKQRENPKSQYNVANEEHFIKAIRRFMDMQKLTAPLLRELIDEITVYETQGVGENRSQRIMIHYRFNGYIEIP